MEEKVANSDVPKGFQSQEKEVDQDSDRKREEAGAGGGSEMEEIEDDTINSEVSKVTESVGRVPNQDADEDVEGSEGGGVDNQEEELDKVTAQLQELSSGGGGKQEESTQNNEDDVILLQILPREIWEKVTKCVEDADSLHNLAKSSAFFKDLLAPKKTLYLFSSVLEILGRKFLENYRNPGVYNELYNEEDDTETEVPEVICDCGMSRMTQQFSGMLKLRMVSKIWSNAMDKFIRNGPLQEGYGSNQIALRPGTSIWNECCTVGSYDFCSDKYYLTGTEFFRHFHETHAITGDDGGPGNRSPFLYGKVLLGDDPVYVMDMLRLYGSHVQHCTFNKWDADITPASAYSLNRQAMELMPNLKRLEFNYFTDCRYWKRKDVKHEAREEMNLRLMPILKDLQLLSFIYGDPKMFSSILQVNNHVSTLIIGHLMDHEDDFDMFTLPLPNLTKLQVRFFHEINFWKFVNLEFKLNLTHLDLRFAYIPEQLSVVFDMISQKCGDHLIDLKLEFLERGDAGKIRGYQDKFNEQTYHLPNLKALSFKLKYFCSLDFLLPVKETLEYLEVEFGIFPGDLSVADKEKAVNEEEGIKFLSCIFAKNGYLLDSNIWEVAYKLTEIKYKENSDSTTYIHMSRHDWQLGSMGLLEIHDDNDDW